MEKITDNEIKEMAREAHNAYQREWRAKNKDKVKASNERYWEKRVKRLLAEENKDCEEVDNGKQ